MDAGSLYDRMFISQYSIQTIGVQIHLNGVLADPDSNIVTLDFVRTDVDPDASLFTAGVATRDSIGTYHYQLQSLQSNIPGEYEARWHFSFGSQPQILVGYIEVGESAPAYDALSTDYKGIIDATWPLFADLFDSPTGGPNLLTYFQANWNRGRMAQLLGNAFDAINLAGPIITQFDMISFPFAKWGALLREALFIEAIKHLIRSYVEQPDPQFVNVAWLNRRDYMQRWMAVLEIEQKSFDKAVGQLKVEQLGLGRPRVLVSGGVFGTIGPTRTQSAPARPRYWARFY